MTICHYISAHGFGHAVRSTAVIKQLPPDLPLIIKSGVAPWFIADALGDRPYELIPDRFDCGALQRDGLEVDPLATFAACRELSAQNARRLDAEAEFLRERNVRLVVADIVPFACRAAARAGVPSLVIANFTWVDIMRPMLEAHPDGAAVVEELTRDYAQASQALIVPPACACDVLPRREAAPMVARRGRARREEIAAALGFDPRKKLYLFYLGELGLDGVDWRRLEEFDDAVFLAFHPPADAPANMVSPPQNRWYHPDITASCDAVVGKPGYGIIGECLANGTPFLYTARECFAEYFALDDALQEWGGAVRIPREDFAALRWRPYLERLSKPTPAPPFPLDGAEYCARKIVRMHQDSGK